jgi:hypothetical protein
MTWEELHIQVRIQVDTWMFSGEQECVRSWSNLSGKFLGRDERSNLVQGISATAEALRSCG